MIHRQQPDLGPQDAFAGAAQVTVPGNAAVSNDLGATVSYQFDGGPAQEVTAAAIPIFRFHSAEYRVVNRKIDSFEASRVLGYWRIGGYSPNPAGADKYSATNGWTGGDEYGLHSADYNNDWAISVGEADRLLTYWRTNGYHVNLETDDGYDAGLVGDGPTLRVLPPNMIPTVTLAGPATYTPGETIAFPIAHHDGNYFADPESLARVEGNGQVAFRYADGTNPNGSINDIAGVFNEGRNVLGLMPHPENLIEAAHGGMDGRALFGGLLEAA